MLLSIIVPVYNEEKHLSRCINSLIEQDLIKEEYEIIIVNDGSTDNSTNIAQGYKKKFSNIILINQSNHGLGAARNVGIKSSSGKYLHFVDSDDYIKRDVIGKLVKTAIERDLEILGFGITGDPKYYEEDIHNRLELELEKGHTRTGISLIGDFNYNNSPCWYLVKRDYILKNSLYFKEGCVAEDGYFTAELLIRSRRVLNVKPYIYFYIKKENSIITKRDNDHLRKVNNDYIIAVKRFSYLIGLLEKAKKGEKAISRIKARQESYVFFFFIREIIIGSSNSHLRKKIKNFRALQVYPIKNFIGLDYHTIQQRILVYIINHRLLLMLLVSLNKIIKVVK